MFNIFIRQAQLPGTLHKNKYKLTTKKLLTTTKLYKKIFDDLIV